MKYNLLALDVCEECEEEFKNYAIEFDADFTRYETISELEERLENENAPTVLLFDVEKNEEIKYRLSAKYKSRSNTHIFFISSNMDPDDRVRWLTYGATGYFKKPYRVEEILRRTHTIVNLHQDSVINDADFFIDFKNRIVEYQGKSVKTTPRLFDLIAYLVTNEGKIITRDEILREVLGIKDYLTDRNIDTMIKQIRKKTSYDVVTTVRGRGYVYRKKDKN